MKEMYCVVFLLVNFIFCTSHVNGEELLGGLGGFEINEGWDVSFEDGGRGLVKRVEKPVRSGKYALEIKKTNGVGYIRITTKKNLNIKVGIEYTIRGYFHSDNAPVLSVLLFRTSKKATGNLYYDKIDRSFGWPSQSLIINSPHGRWVKRAIHYKSAYNKKVYVNIVVYGNPATVYLDDLQFTDDRYPFFACNRSRFDFPYTKKEVYGILKKKTSGLASFVTKNSRTVLNLNGKETPISMFKASPYRQYPYVHAYKDFDNARIPLAIRSLMISSYKTEPGIWEAENKYRWDLLEKDLMLALRRSPNSNLVLEMVCYHPYDRWSEENSREIWQNENGEKAYGYGANLIGFTNDLKRVDKRNKKHWWYPSYHSGKWKKDTAKAMEDIVKHIMSTPLGKAVVGFHITGGHDGQFQSVRSDHSPVAQNAFRLWLKGKYGNVVNLNSAWKTYYKDFEKIKVPVKRRTLIAEGYETPFYAVGFDSDYRLFQDEETWKLKDYFAGVVKKASGKPVFTGAYGSLPGYESWKMMRLKNLDYETVAGWYAFRYPGYALGAKPKATFNLYNKMWVNELDLRTWTQHSHDEVYEMWISQATSDEMFKSIYRKMVGVVLVHGYAWWHYSMQHYFDDPLIMGQIAKAYRISEQLQKMKKNPFRPDVCVVETDYPNRFVAPNFGSGRIGNSIPLQQMMLETSGVPYDVHYLDDILRRPELQKYKVYVFFHNIYLAEKQRKKIDLVLKNKNKILVWMYNTGYISESGKSAKKMSTLIEMTIKTSEKFERGTPLLKEGAPFTKGAMKFQGAEELLLSIMSLKGSNSFIARPQPFWVEDLDATPIAVYRESGKVAMAVKEFDDWTSVYLAAPSSLGNDLLYNIAKNAGAFVVAAPGQSIFMNGNFISLHALKTGVTTFNLPPEVKNVIDADTKEILAKDSAKYSFYVDAGETRWFLLQ